MSELHALLREQRVIVCCGTGGVGKTTTAAALAVEGARAGRRTVVVTIDPAKRLASTLGLDHLSNTPSLVDRTRWDPDGVADGRGELQALMLDTKTTFDQLIRKYAIADEQADRILANGFYRNVSGALSGTQEYMAMEKLYELHCDPAFDLIVVDTPPTRHTLEFLDAPQRLTRLLDNRVFRMLMVPTRTTLRITGVAAQTLLRTIGRVVGSEVVEDVVSFFRAFEGMESGFRERAGEASALLASGATTYVLVTSPRRDAVQEAEYFAEQLGESGLAVGALVVNRIHPSFGVEEPSELERQASVVMASHPNDERAVRLAGALGGLAEFQSIARRERHQLEGLERRLEPGAVVHIPELTHDICDFASLHELGLHLLA